MKRTHQGTWWYGGGLLAVLFTLFPLYLMVKVSVSPPAEVFTVKGNEDSMLYHVPGSSFYARTVAEVWFTDAEAAEAAGFSLPPSQRAEKKAADQVTEESE